jgi:CubicO group peptidase (beta-lactamase class C family)
MVDARVPALLAALTVAAAACSAPAPDPAEPGLTATIPTITDEPVVYPGSTWDRDERGDFAALDADLDAMGSSCVAVVQDGSLVHDAYWNGGGEHVPVRTYSITKSLTSALVMMAVGADRVDLDAPASEQVAEWAGTSAEAVTVRDLLSMTSGREWSEATDRTLIRQVTDQTAYAIGLRQAAEPGEWVYDNAAPQVLERVLAAATGEDVVELAERHLLDPLGMDDTTWARDAAGHATTYSGLTSTCQDLARFGYLMLHDGRWADQQLVPADLVAESTVSSSEENAAYGLLWWTNGEGRVVEARRQAGFAADVAPYEGRIAPNVPADAFWAFGYGNQYVAVVPSEDLVAVRLGRRPATPDQVTFDTFTAGVLEALEGS